MNHKMDLRRWALGDQVRQNWHRACKDCGRSAIKHSGTVMGHLNDGLVDVKWDCGMRAVSWEENLEKHWESHV